jgi:hypothetical protein
MVVMKGRPKRAKGWRRRVRVREELWSGQTRQLRALQRGGLSRREGRRRPGRGPRLPTDTARKHEYRVPSVASARLRRQRLLKRTVR